MSDALSGFGTCRGSGCPEEACIASGFPQACSSEIDVCSCEQGTLGWPTASVNFCPAATRESGNVVKCGAPFQDKKVGLT